MKKVNIGLIGAGRMGRLHGENLAHAVHNAKLYAVADPFLNEATIEWAESMGVDADKCYKDPQDILKDPEIDAVFICSSTDTHATLIKESAKAGKDIFCEKPIHHDLDEIHAALKEVEKAGVKLQIGFVRRFDHNHKAVHDVVANGKLGAPCVVKVTSRDPDHQPMEYIRTSGGIFIDMTIHDFDMVRYLSGSEVTEVTAYGSVCENPEYAEMNDVDTAIVLMKFENGALGVIDNSRASHYGYDQRSEVQCQNGCVTTENDLENEVKVLSADGVSSAKPTWFLMERYTQAFIFEDQAFVDAVLNDTEPLVKGIDGLKPVEIALAANKSLKEGRTVKISEIL